MDWIVERVCIRLQLTLYSHLNIALSSDGQMFTQMENWADEFGGDYMLQAFGRRMVVLTSFADIRRVLAMRPSKFCRGIDSVS